MLHEIGRVIGLCALESSALLLAAMTGCSLWRGGSAAQKHLVLSITLVGCLLLPTGEALFPKVNLPVLSADAEGPELSGFAGPAPGRLPVSATSGARASAEMEDRVSSRPFSSGAIHFSEGKARAAAIRPASPMEWGASGALLWGAGVLLFGGYLGISSLRLRRLRRNARAVGFSPEILAPVCDALKCGRIPDVCTHPKVCIPMIAGVFRPTIFLPEASSSWSDGCLQSVLRHEIAHLVRGDLLVQKFINLSLALYWFNPLAWAAAARIRKEREKACDDLVITTGERASVYAEGLLEVVKNVRGTYFVPAGAIGMAQSSKIGLRIHSILSSAVNRVAPSRRMAAWMVAAGSAIVLVLGTVRIAHAAPKKSPAPKPPSAAQTLEKGRMHEKALAVVTVRVVNESGEPIAGAEVEPIGLRSDPDLGSWYGLGSRLDEVKKPEKTDARGETTVLYPKFVSENVPTGTVIVRASHPDFCSGQLELRLAEPMPMVLKVGTEIVLKAHLPGSREPLKTVRADMASWNRNWLNWSKVADGITARIPDRCEFRAVAFDENGALLFSREVLIEAGTLRRKVLDLEVRKGVEFRGKLSANVPRPVLNGRVVAVVSSPSLWEKDLRNFWYTGADVDSSGDFLLKNLPEGEIKLIALCDGFVSKDPRGKQDGVIRNGQTFDFSSSEVAEVAMEKSGTAEIAVLSPEGNPVPNATVAFSPNQSMGGGNSLFGRRLDPVDFLFPSQSEAGKKRVDRLKDNHAFRATTNAQGIARVGELPPGSQIFLIDAEGLDMPVSREVRNATMRQATLEIKPGETSTQTVRMEPRGTTSLRDAMAKAFTAMPSEGSAARPKETTGAPYGVEAGKDLIGQVVDENGKPLKGVVVDAWTWCPGNETKSDAEGRFKLSGLDPDEEIEVQFALPGFSPVHITRQPVGKLKEPVVLSNKIYFQGVVTDHSGKPVAGQLVRVATGAKRADGVLISHLWHEGITDEKGAYRIDVHPDTYEFQVRSPGGEVARLAGQTVGRDENKRVNLTLAPGLVFSARLVDSVTGKPVPGVRLYPWQQPGMEGTSDAAGEIRIGGMLPGEAVFEVEAEKAGCRRWWSEQAKHSWERKEIEKSGWQRNFDSLAFEIGAASTPVEIVMEQGVAIRGIVKDPEGKPVPGATVTAAHTGTGNSLTGDTRFSVLTAADGTFRLLLPASNAVSYNLMAHDGKYKEWRKWANGVLPPFQTRPGEKLDGVEIRLNKPAIVRGRVLDVVGKPIANHEIQARAVDALENRYYDPAARTKADGTFELRFLRAGKHYIQTKPFWLDPREAPPGSVATVDADPDRPVEGVELTAKLR